MELAGATAVFEALNRAGIDYLVVGGLAVNAHGYVRMTMDIDLVVSLEPGNITRALYALAEIGANDTHSARSTSSFRSRSTSRSSIERPSGLCSMKI